MNKYKYIKYYWHISTTELNKIHGEVWKNKSVHLLNKDDFHNDFLSFQQPPMPDIKQPADYSNLLHYEHPNKSSASHFPCTYFSGNRSDVLTIEKKEA